MLDWFTHHNWILQLAAYCLITLVFAGGLRELDERDEERAAAARANDRATARIAEDALYRSTIAECQRINIIRRLLFADFQERVGTSAVAREAIREFRRTPDRRPDGSIRCVAAITPPR